MKQLSLNRSPRAGGRGAVGRGASSSSFFFITLGLELSGTKVYEPSIRALYPAGGRGAEGRGAARVRPPLIGFYNTYNWFL